MSKQPKLPLQFPKHFLWGAASAAHQIEGGQHNQWTVWELENAKVLAETAKYGAKYLPKWDEVKVEATNPANYISGKTADHYHKYAEDFALLKKLNMNAWRFSIEWSRIEPEEGAWSAEAIQHYRQYFKKLKALDIEPIVTLWHWTVPLWFSQQGGFAKRENIKYFERFAAKIFEEFGREFTYVITLNEPEIYVAKSYWLGEWPPQIRSKYQGFRVLMNLLAAHKRVYKMAKQVGRKYKVSIAKNSIYQVAGDDAKLTQFTAAMARWTEDYFILNRIKKQLDFIGLNYYMTNRYYGYRRHNDNLRINDLGWGMHPANLEFVLKDLADRYNLPIIITENGVADRDDEYRKWWLTHTIMAMNKAIHDGVHLEGYLHWSLLDNFEWSSGFWPRFGLAEVDYKTQARTLRPSAVWFGAVIKKLRG